MRQARKGVKRNNDDLFAVKNPKPKPRKLAINIKLVTKPICRIFEPNQRMKANSVKNIKKQSETSRVDGCRMNESVLVSTV